MTMDLLEEASSLFVRQNFSEAKDLLKTFITLVSTILVFSVTFGERIVDFRNGHPATRWSLFSAWGLFVVAIIAAGLALVSLVALTGLQAGSPAQQAEAAWFVAWHFILVCAAGFAFIGGLVAIVLAGLLAMRLPLPSPDSSSSREPKS